MERANAAFPLVVALEGLEEWLLDPATTDQRRLDDFLAGIARAAGAAGAVLDVDAEPLPAFEARFGTLEDPAAHGQRPAVTGHEIRADDGAVRLGMLWFDGVGPAGPLAVRAITLALESAWTRARLRASADRLAALEEAIRGIAVLDVERVLQLIVDRVRELVGARYAGLGIVGRAGSIERFVTSGISPEEWHRIGPPPKGHGLLGLITREGRSLRIPDVTAHPDAYGFPPNHPVMRSLLGVPIRVKGEPIGNLYLCDRVDGRDFGEADQALVEGFAVHAGIAIENARLHVQVQRLAIVEERERISKDLHDGIIQALYGVSLNLEDVPDLMADDPPEARSRVDRAIDSLNQTIREIRMFIQGLQSELAVGADLTAGLANLAHEFALNTLIDVELDLDDGRAAAVAMSVEQRVHLLQMAREALSNAQRHARASRTRVSLREEAGGITMEIADDGIGFDPDAVPTDGHFGLINLRSRAAAMHGALIVDSAPGKGTRIIVQLPAEATRGAGAMEVPPA